MKKFLALFLALALTLTVAGCSTKPDPTPAPDVTVQAMLDVVLRNDFTLIQNLFGYTSSEAVINDLFDGQTVMELIMDSAKSSLLGEELPISDEDFSLLISAIFNMLGRTTITCETVSVDEENGTAIVAVTVNTYSAVSLEDDLTEILQTALLQNLDLLSDEDALYSLIVRETVKFLDSMVPSEETVTINIVCTLEEDVINGKTRSIWMPDAEALGEEIATAILPL